MNGLLPRVALALRMVAHPMLAELTPWRING